MNNVGITILIFGAMIGVGYVIYKNNIKGIKQDAEKNWG